MGLFPDRDALSGRSQACDGVGEIQR